MAVKHFIQLDEPALELVIDKLKLNDIYCLEEAFPEIAHLTSRVLDKVETYPIEGRNYRFRQFEYINGVRSFIHSDSFFPLIKRLKNLESLRLVFPIRSNDYENGFQIGQNCLKLKQVVGSKSTFGFVNGIIDGLLTKLQHSEVNIEEVTITEVNEPREMRILYDRVNRLPHFRTVRILICPCRRLECVTILRKLKKKPDFNLIVPSSVNRLLDSVAARNPPGATASDFYDSDSSDDENTFHPMYLYALQFARSKAARSSSGELPNPKKSR